MAAITVASCFYMGVLGLQVPAFQDRKTISMPVSDSGGLVEGSRVLLRGIEVGTVESVEPAAGAVDVRWTVDNDQPIPRRSEFRIENLSALGEAFVEIRPSGPGGPYLRDGDRLAPDEVTVPSTMKELSVQLTNVLSQLDSTEVSQVLRELDTGLPEGYSVTQTLNVAGTLLASTLQAQSATLSTLLTNMQPMLLDSRWMSDGMRDSAPRLPRIASGLGEFMDPLYDMQQRLPLPAAWEFGTGPFLADTQEFLDKTAADLQVLGVTLLPSVRAATSAVDAIDVSRLLDAGR